MIRAFRSVPSHRVLVVVAVLLLLSMAFFFWGFVQDDAYISLRYARNLAEGKGLCFNPHEWVEGYTNFSWTVLGAALLYVGLDALFWLRLLGVASALAAVILVALTMERLRRGGCLCGVPSLFLGTSTSLALWCVSGLEAAFYTALVFGAWEAYERRRVAPSIGLFVLAFLTRPETGLFFGLVCLDRLLQWRGGRAFTRREWIGLAVLLVVVGLYHGWRHHVFGSLLPNTYYIKGVGGRFAWSQGWAQAREFLRFDGNGVLAGLAALALVLRPRREHLVPAAALVLYGLYVVKVGGDILPLFRLWVTILPFLTVLAGEGLFAVAELLGNAREKGWIGRVLHLELRGAYKAVVVALVTGLLVLGVRESVGHPEYRGVREALDMCHGACGRYMNERAPGEVCVGQDMGVMPWEAPLVHFVDAIGLCDRTVGRTLSAIDYTPYIRYLLWPDAEARARILRAEAELADYLMSYEPMWFAVNVSVPDDRVDEARMAAAELDPSFFRPLVEANVFYYGVAKRPAFREGYALVRVWEYSHVHYMVLYERKGPRRRPRRPECAWGARLVSAEAP